MFIKPFFLFLPHKYENFKYMSEFIYVCFLYR